MGLQSNRMPRIWATTGLAIIASCGLTALALPGRPAAAPDKAGEGKAILLLDGYIQSRFEDDVKGFGMSRMPPPVRGHYTIRYDLSAAKPSEKELIKEIQALGFDYIVEFVHCTHVQGRKQIDPQPLDNPPKVLGMSLVAARSGEGPRTFAEFSSDRNAFYKENEAPIQKRAEADVAKLMKGANVDATIGTWRVAYRPVRASKTSCLNCHEGANAGDVLGVMAYAVRKPQDKPAANTPSQAVSQR